jgi:polysaccharide chain length determinant protein (PEP-CTERM system associated)
MLPGKTYSPEEVLRIIVRGRWLILLPAVLGVVGGVAASTRMPEKYRSETLILVVPQRIPADVVRRTNTETVEDRLNTINDLILSRSRLERIIRDLNLYGHGTDAVMEDLVQRMRDRDIRVSVEGRESFRVAYVSDTAKTAQLVTDRLASLYIEENLRDQTLVAQSTNQFLESQLDDAKRRLVEQERKLEDYKSRHAGELPSQLEANLQSIQNAQSQLQAVSESTNRARERRILIERQLADAQTMPVAARPLENPTSSTEPTALSAAQQLEAAEARLALYKQRYTPDHPDVRALERAIPELKNKVDEEAKLPAAKPGSKFVTPAEAARQRQVNELRAQLEAIDLQISSNQREESRLKGLVAAYQIKVNAVPARESELVELMRDYDTVNESYSSLLKKQQDSKIAENLVRQQIGEQFRVLDPASLPQRPYNRLQRLLILLASPFLGMALGLGVLGWREYRDSSLKSEAEVARLLAVPVLAMVPILESDREQQVRLRRMRLLDFGGSAIVLVTLAGLVFWSLQS